MHPADTPKQSVPLLQKMKTATFWLLDGLPNHRFTLQTHLTQMKEKPAGLSVTVNINHEHAYMSVSCC